MTQYKCYICNNTVIPGLKDDFNTAWYIHIGPHNGEQISNYGICETCARHIDKIVQLSGHIRALGWYDYKK